ncbi:hypothetical protein [Kitasatospora sp. NPDC017646]|uniref:hypothetical protein n=1 Tax=Kitasatospora sp. NPDC017646 TaxID=3364024 RepID=UPI003799D6FD
MGDAAAGGAGRSGGAATQRAAEIDAEVARLEAAEVVFGQFADARRTGKVDDPAMAEEFERVTISPGAGGMLLVPHREEGMDTSALPVDYQTIMKIVAGASQPVPAKDVSVELGRGTGPGQVEPVRDKLRRLTDRGWLHRTPAGRFTALPASAA